MVEGFQIIIFHVDGGDVVGFAVNDFAHLPIRIIVIGLGIGELDGFHHLTDNAVSHDVGGHTVFFSHFKGENREVAHFLNGVGGEDQTVITAVTAALDQLEIVRLFRTDVSETRTAAGDVNDDGRHFVGGEIADTFLLQTDTQTGTAGHGAASACGGTDDHVDGTDFGFSLNEGAFQTGEEQSGGVSHFTCRGDRVTEETVAAREQSAVDGGFIAFEQQALIVLHDVTPQFQKW